MPRLPLIANGMANRLEPIRTDVLTASNVADIGIDSSFTKVPMSLTLPRLLVTRTFVSCPEWSIHLYCELETHA